jgi:hypothetical protein
MNKNNKILPPIIAFILSIIIGQVILWIINRTELDIIANMLEVLISILNFIFVIYIFKNDQKYREEERQLNKNQKEKEYSLYWYQTFILPDSIKYIKEFKDELYNLVDNNLKIENTVDSNKYAEYTRLHIKCKNNVTEILKVISPKTEQAIRTRFSDFQDEFSKLVYETGTLEDMKKAIIENETKLLEVLYKYEIF